MIWVTCFLSPQQRQGSPHVRGGRAGRRPRRNRVRLQGQERENKYLTAVHTRSEGEGFFFPPSDVFVGKEKKKSRYGSRHPTSLKRAARPAWQGARKKARGGARPGRRGGPTSKGREGPGEASPPHTAQRRAWRFRGHVRGNS